METTKELDDEDRELYPTGKNWAWSENEENLLLANPNPYRYEILFMLYEKTNPEDGRYLTLPEDWKADSWQVDQITACRPPKGYEHSRIDYTKWNSGTHDHRVDDVFDTLKMGLTVLDIAKKEANWIHEMDFTWSKEEAE